MRETRTKRRAWIPTVEGMESRAVLSTMTPSLSAAMVRELKASLIPAIKGTIQGTVTSITPISATSQIVTYDGKGKANIIGDGRGTGQHTITSRPLRNGGSTDTYRNGSLTVKGTTDLVSVHYTGTGRTNKNGSFTATLRGTAQSVAGANAGLSGSFTAQLSGNSRTGTFMINFTARV